ncbi:3-keto-disaccharide hydrolase [Niabella soli]|uniref:3-keto-alpha-glucoside-1,2-lyase/3-keto-2-hydroxy-glucal hydratase domain-containing protein n=1 Tax=Niabella soli DSM 19437 TaxID=929713 RepID=W0F1Y1_9BACT|nr:DUF1080 domain-containing protein [Niabella soli]AHF15803.1 hypothetical protein NIASO_12800 [Niabella soli DSM 19437]
MKKVKLFAALLLLGTSMQLKAQLPALTKKEKKQGWVLLFNGKTFDGWKKASGQPFTAKGWQIDDGVLSVNPADGHGGDIVTDRKFSDFELSVEFKVEKGANSGIKYYLLPNTSLGCEYQIIDDENHPDAKLGIAGNRRLASFYDVIPAPLKKPVKPVGQWNKAVIIAKNNHVEHWLNGVKMLEYDRGSAAFNAGIAKSKFKNEKGFGLVKESPILLQEHGDTVHFRNIKIRPLTK